MTAEFLAGLLYGLPLGAALLVIGLMLVDAACRRLSVRRTAERYHSELAVERERRWVRLCLQHYEAGDYSMPDRVLRIKGRKALRERFGAIDE